MDKEQLKSFIKRTNLVTLNFGISNDISYFLSEYYAINKKNVKVKIVEKSMELDILNEYMAIIKRRKQAA